MSHKKSNGGNTGGFFQWSNSGFGYFQMPNWGGSESQKTVEKNHKPLTFDKVERKIAQAIQFFRAPAPENAKDKTIFNREVHSQLQAQYRADEIHRLDLLEMVAKAKKFHIMEIPCKSLGVWEDDQKICEMDRENIESNPKRGSFGKFVHLFGSILHRNT